MSAIVRPFAKELLPGIAKRKRRLYFVLGGYSGQETVPCKLKSAVKLAYAVIIGAEHVTLEDRKSINDRMKDILVYLRYLERSFVNRGPLTSSKPGNYRSPAQTIELCQEQIRIAVQSGAASKLEAHMREHGTKDWTVFPILEDVAEIGKVLRKREEGKVALPNDEAEAALQLELDRTLKDYIGNPLLDMKGMYSTS